MAATDQPIERPPKDVRKQAEQRTPKAPVDISQMSAEEIRRSLYELEVHQEELKVQNEELRRLQLELESSHDRLADLYDFAPVGYVTVDANGVIINANLATATMLGRDRAKIVGTRLVRYCDDGSRIELRDHFEKVLSSKMSHSCEVKFATPLGATFDARLVSNHVVTSGIGDDRNCRVIITDISSDKAAESKLRQGEERYRRLVDNSPFCIYEFELDGTVSAVNPAGLKVAGLSDISQVRGAGFLSRVSEDDKPQIGKLFDRAKQGHISYFEVGSVRGHAYESCFVPVTDDAGKVRQIMCIAQDISKRKQHEAALRESEDLFRGIFQQAAVGVAQLDSVSGVILKANERYSEILNTPTEKLLGKTWMELTHPDDLAFDLLNMARLRSGEIREFSMEKRLQRDDGSFVWINLTVSPMWQPGEEPSTHIAIVQDITERKKSESERERLLDILQRSLNEIYVFDSETLRFEYVNAGALRNLGYSLDEMHCMTPVDIKPGYTETTFRDLIAPLQSRKQEVLRFETIHQRANGSRYPVEVHLQLVRWANHEVFLAIILDITDRKLQEQKFRTIVETTQEWIWEIDLQGVHTYSNPAIETILGYSVDEIVGGNALELLYEQDREVVESELPRLVAQKQGWTGWHLRWRHKDGSIRQLESNGTPILDENNRLIGFRGADRDITARKEADDALRESRERFRQLAENIHEVFWLTDMAIHKVLYVSPPYEQIWGRSIEALYADALEWTNAIHPEDRERVAKSFLDNGPFDEWEETYRIVRPDGTERFILDRAFPVRDESGTVIRLAGISEDITERKQAEESLRLRDQAFRTAITPIAFGDLDGRINDANQAFAELLGFENVESLIGMLNTDFHSSPISMARINESIIESGGFNGEITITRNDGKPVEVQLSATLFADANGRPIGSMATFMDVTPRRQVERALRESEQRTRTLVEAAPEAIVVLDVDERRFVDVNENAAKLFRVERERLWEIGPMELSPEIQPDGRDSATTAMEFVQRALDGEVPVFEWIHLDSEGNEIPCEIRLVRLPSSRRLIRASVINITERIELKNALSRRAIEAELLYRAVAMADEVDSLDAALQKCVDIVCELTSWPVGHVYVPSPSGAQRLEPTQIWHFADEQRFTKFREASERTSFGLGEGLPGRIWHSGEPAWIVNVQQDDNFLHDEFCEDLGVKGAFGFPVRIKGKTVAILEFFNEEEVERNETLLLFVRSVGEQVGRVIERKLAEEALRKSDEQLRELNASLEQRVAERTAELAETNAELAAFAHTVSHDLRSPLRAMEGFATALAEDYGERLDEAGHEFIQHIVDSAKRMDELVSDLLAYSRLGRADIQVKAIDLNAILEETLGQLRSDIEACNAKVAVAEQMPSVLGHKATLVQVVTNLLSNAMKFVADGTRPEVFVWAERRSDGMLRLWVEDNGIGIAEAYQDRIFRVFERLHGIESYPGTGIGLAIVARACERLGGRCGFESQRDHGSKFWVEFKGGEEKT